MISLRVFIASLALAVKLDSVHAAWPSPLTFYYKPDYPYDNMHVDIILQNVPPEATRYVLYYQTDNCDKTTTGVRSAGCNVPATYETIPTNKTITILQKLNKRSVRIYIEIQKINNKLCAMKPIMDGAARDNNSIENRFSRECLNEKSDLCEINVDFGNQCEEQTRAKINFSQHDGRLVCEVSDEVSIPEDTTHQWYQTYKDNTLIGTIPTVKGSKTEFRMTIHKFDSNTYISSAMRSTHRSTNTEPLKVPLPEKRYENYVVKHTKKYTENEQVTFSCPCPRYEHTQIGWIEATGIQIATYDRVTFTWRFIKEQNGTMLCCLNYYTKTFGKTTVVERNVTNITVMIYEEPVHQGDVKEQTRAKISCSQKKRLTCEVGHEQLPEDTVHQWYQSNINGTVIVTIPPVKGKKTEYKITIHKFDINTYIYNAMSSTNWKKTVPSEPFKVPENSYKYYDVDHLKKYTANEPVRFNCSNNAQPWKAKPAHTQIGVIESTGFKIATYNVLTFTWRFIKEQNGTMLCCLHYYTETVGRKTVVERTVTDITELIYEEPVHQGNAKDLPLYKPTNSAPEVQPNTPGATSNIHQHVRAPGGPAGQHSESPWKNYYIAIAAVAGLILLISLTYVVIKKCWRQSSDPEQTLQLETYATTNMVLYAELDIRPGTAPAPATTEEATYAEIIGVLRPENGHVKK